MSRSIEIKGLNVPVRLANFDFAEAARNGETAQGGIDIDSENAAIDTNGHWPIRVRDTQAVGVDVFNGYMADKAIARGPWSVQSDRQLDHNTVDLNTKLIDDIMTGSSANRPEETDIARVTWLVGTSFLDGMGSTIGASGATTLEAHDYRTQQPLSLLTEAAETAGKLFFVYWDFATEAPKLFYDLATASNFITSSKISTYLPDGSNSTTHHPAKDSLIRNLDYGRIYSELLFKYDGGSVTVTNAATASNYRARKTVIYDNTVKTEAHATRKANQYLNSVSTPEDVITLDVDLTAAQINEFRAGQLMQIKAPHLGLPTFVDRRIVRTSKKPRGGGDNPDSEDYTVTMELSPPKSNRFGSRGNAIDTLPDEVGGGSTEPAPTEGVDCASTTFRIVEYFNTGFGTGDEIGYVSFPAADFYVGSWVYNNIAYAACGCPIGGGGWVGYFDQQCWYEFTAPADDPDYLGLSITLDLSDITTSGYVGGWTMKIVGGTAAAATVGTFYGGTQVGSGGTAAPGAFYIPRTHVTWGATNSIVFAPAWRCVRGAFYCNEASSFISPADDGRGNSGLYDHFNQVVDTICALRFTVGATGSSGWVAGLGDTDGVNAEFGLIGWSGAGTVEASINGLVQPNSDVTLDPYSLTATFADPPPSGATVLFLYTVSA